MQQTNCLVGFFIDEKKIINDLILFDHGNEKNRSRLFKKNMKVFVC